MARSAVSRDGQAGRQAGRQVGIGLEVSSRVAKGMAHTYRPVAGSWVGGGSRSLRTWGSEAYAASEMEGSPSLE